jgi:serine/threonine-protein kinase
VQNTNPKTKPDEDDIPEPLADHPRYKVVRELGAGGMGVVYKAEHRIMGRPVALKVMAAHLTAKAGAVERFRKEVRAAAQLNHPNIVTAHDADEAGGLHFLVMEFVEGISLDRFVAKKGPATIQLAASFTRQAALGLQHAHEKGMVHRDIKPQNMMVNRKAQVKVMDFGLARFVHTDEEEAATRPGGRLPFGSAKPVADPLTNPNLIMGTPDYLSPEQARNSHNVDSRSDIYSLGCTLFFLLTGRPPFSDASSLIDKLLAHTEQAPPPIRELRPDVPEGFAAILDRMLAKKPDDRFETAGDVAVAIQSFIRGTGDAEPKVSEVLEVAAPASGVGLRSPGALTPSPIPMEFDTEPAAREQTLGDTEKPRKTKKSKKAKAKPWWQHPAAKIGAVATLLMVVALAIAVGGKKKDTQPTSSSDDTANNRPALPVNPKGSGPVSHDTKGPNQGDWKGPKDGDPKWPGKGPNLPDLKGPNFPEPKGGPNYPDPKGPDHFEPKGPFVPKGGQLPPVAPWMRPGKPPLPVLYVVPSRELFGGDYFPVAGRLHEQGVKVVTACGQGIEAELIRGMPGDLKAVPVDLRVEQAKAEDYSAIIFCGFNVDEYVMPRGNDYSIAKATRDLLEKFRRKTSRSAPSASASVCCWFTEC